MRSNLFSFVIAFSASLALANAGVAADSVAGRVLAERWCVKCHNIEKGAPFKLRPPSFAAIAIYRAENDIRGKIISPHIGMPDIMWMLQAEDIDNIVAYIASLDAK